MRNQDHARFARQLGEIFVEHSPVVMLLVGGFAGSGKSELAKLLARKLNWPLLDKDTMTRPWVEVYIRSLNGDADDRHSKDYLEKVRPLEYITLMATADEVTALGSSVVVTAPFLKELQDQSFLDRIQDKFDFEKIETRVVWMVSDHDTMRKRMTSRGAGRDRWKLANWNEYVSQTDMELRPRLGHEAIDNSSTTTETLVGQADNLIESWDLA